MIGGVLAKFACSETCRQKSLLNCDTDNKGMHMSIALSMNESLSSLKEFPRRGRSLKYSGPSLMTLDIDNFECLDNDKLFNQNFICLKYC